ncbi:MAG: glycoside hydrolase N-terminal domain-containing protein [Candidatus Brocadiia bacterium]
MNDEKCGMMLRQPAMRWQDGCPVGNGLIGAMLYGHIRNEQILFNHECFWRRRPRPDIADISDLRDELCRLLHEGKYEEARNLFPNAMTERDGAGRRPDPYLPLGWVHLDFNRPGGIFERYRRGVDFTTAEAWTRWIVFVFSARPLRASSKTAC